MMNTIRTEPASHNAFFTTAALLFAASAAVTIAWCMSMSAMDEMTMPGGWSMSMTWMRMPDQTWIDVAASFLGMWTVMMVAMMLPSLVPMLGRYRVAVANPGQTRLALLTLRVATAYFLVWVALGLAAFAAGIAITQIEMHVAALSRMVPIAVGIVVSIAGAVQFTPWKMHHLACWRDTPEVRTLDADPATAWRYGLRLGRRCAYGCANLTVALLVIGVMDLWAMALVTAAITAERFAPDHRRAARVVGVIVIAIGLFLIAQALSIE